MGTQSHTINSAVEIVRPLTAADLAGLDQPKGVVPFPLKKIRDSHHLLARCIASGFSLAEIAEKTGYSYSRISILKSDPTFQELIAVYRAKVDEVRDVAMKDYYVQLAALHGDVVEELHDWVLDETVPKSPSTLLDIAKFTADRIGLGPTHKSQSLNVNVDYSARVAAGRQRAQALSAAGEGSAHRSLPAPAPVQLPLGENDE